jgi:hypothetical protein
MSLGSVSTVMIEQGLYFHYLFRLLTLYYSNNIEFSVITIWHTYREHKPKGENLFFFKLRSPALLLPIAEYQKIRRCRGLHKHSTNMQFFKNQSTVRKFKWGDSHINGQLHVHKHIMVFSQGRRYFLRNGQYATSGLNAQRWTSKLQSFNNIN